MKSIDFEIVWQQSDKTPVPEERETLASFTILIDGLPIIDFFDGITNSRRNRLNVPLYPLAEWFVINWWFLFGEKSRHDDYSLRHNIQYTNSGFSFPNLTFSPEGDTISIAWEGSELKHHFVLFLNKGYVRVSQLEFKTKLGEFIKSVIIKLQDAGLHNSTLQTEWEVINNTKKNEEAFCLTAAQLGLDAYSIDEVMQDIIIDVNHTLPNSIKEDFFNSAEPNNLFNLSAELYAAINRASSIETKLSIKKMRREVRGLYEPTRSPIPYVEGYDAAIQLRNYLGLNGEVISNTDILAEILDTPKTNILSSFAEETTKSLNFMGVMAVKNEEPGFVFFQNQNSDIIREPHLIFTFCRGLYEYFFSNSLQTALITTAKTPHQKRNRAFAAELILPSAKLKNMNLPATITDDEVDEIALNFDVPYPIVRHQLKNHHISRVIED
jgi:hypothetical protein